MRITTATTITAVGMAVATLAVAAVSTAAAATAPLCTPGRLQLSQGSSQGSRSVTATTFIFTNVSGRTCALAGYPGMAFIGDKGAVLARRVVRGGTTLFRDPGTRVVTLEPTGAASFTLGTVPQQRTACPLTIELAITPPGGTTPLFLGTPGARGIYVCPGRKLVVSAVVPGIHGAMR